MQGFGAVDLIKQAVEDGDEVVINMAAAFGNPARDNSGQNA